MSSYRQRVYAKYASQFQGSLSQFDASLASKWGKAYDYYLRGLLPEDKGAAIVDLACGGGKLLHFFKTRGFTNLAGVDISLEQVKLAAQVIPDVSHCDVLPYLRAATAKFDLITALDVVEHLHKDEILDFFDAAAKSLKSNGRIIIQTNNGATPWGSIHHYDDFTHETCLTPRTLTMLLSLAGFKNIQCRELGPVPFGYSVKSSLRSILWRCIRLSLKLRDLVENGEIGSGIYSRVFIASATVG